MYDVYIETKKGKMMKKMNHTDYPKRLKKLNLAQLWFIISDCQETLDAMPNGENAGYYADEINYAGMEIARREKS